MNEFQIGTHPVPGGHIACSIDGCEKASFRKGLCVMHLKRLVRHGDPNGGRTKNGERQKFIRDVAASYDGDDCLIWPFGGSTNGYITQQWNGKHVYVHRIICEVAHGPAPSPHHEAAHSCGNGHKGCIAKQHLRWATPVENNQDKILHGTVLRGERSPNAILKEDDVRKIRKMLGIYFQREIAEQFGVSRTLIGRIATGKAWVGLGL